MDAVIMMTSLKKRRDKAYVFLLFVNKAETTSSSLSSPSEDVRGGDGVNGICRLPHYDAGN